MKCKCLITFIICAFISGHLQGQPTIPTVIPESPDASSLKKMYDYPVSNCTGIPDINIPLFEIKSGQLNLPISISYHSSGRRVYDKTGAIGLGWTLNAGGMISRVIFGDPDDVNKAIKYPYPWKKADNITNATDYRFLASIDNRPFQTTWYDTEYDIFTYSANGLYGNFILKDDNNSKTPILIPKKPYQIFWYQKTGTNVPVYYCEYFEIIDDNGIKYVFGKSLKDNIEYHEMGPTAITGWMLTEIISANRIDTIRLKYSTFTTLRQSLATTYTKVSDWFGDPQKYPEPLQKVTSQESSVDEVYSSQRITEISYRQGKIVFNLQQFVGFPITDKNLLVTSITIKNKAGETIETIEFNQSVLNTMSLGTISPYKLDKIIFKDKNSIPIENYAFEYYPSPASIDVRHQDFWGYYNASGKIDMCPFIPSGIDNTVISNPNANRNSNESAMTSGILKKITYPTGGHTEFVYQVNKYYDQGVKPCGGLRIYQIKSVDPNNNTLLRTFTYGLNECGYGYLPLIPSALTMSYPTQRWNMEGNNLIANSFTQTQYFSNILPIFSYVAEKPSIYSNITEYFGDINNPYGNGKIVYEYDRDDITPPTMQVYGSGGVNYRFWKRSDLLSKYVYAKTDDAAHPYKLVKYLINTYTPTEYPTETIYGLRIRRLILALVSGVDAYTSEEYYSQNGSSIYAYCDYSFSIGKKELTQTEEHENGYSKVTTYIYDANHLLKEQRFINSKGITLRKEYLHPVDFTGEPYNTMVIRNIMNPVIEQNQYDNSGLLESTKTNYFNWGNNIITPITVQTKNRINSTYETRIRYHSYDNFGNISSVSKEGDIKTSFIWGYNGAYPVSKIVGSDYSSAYNILSAADKNTLNGNPTDDQVRTIIKKIRDYYLTSNVMVYTYTYKPLVGMASSTDENGKTTYFDYDDFGRLKYSKDQDANILQEYKYHYKE